MTRFIEVPYLTGSRTLSLDSIHGVAPHAKGCVILLATGQKLLCTLYPVKVQWLLRLARRAQDVVRWLPGTESTPEYRAWVKLRSLAQDEPGKPWEAELEPVVPLRVEDLDEILRRGGDLRTRLLDWLGSAQVPFAPVKPLVSLPQPELDEDALQEHRSVTGAWPDKGWRTEPRLATDESFPGALTRRHSGPRHRNDVAERAGFSQGTSDEEAWLEERHLEALPSLHPELGPDDLIQAHLRFQALCDVALERAAADARPRARPKA